MEIDKKSVLLLGVGGVSMHQLARAFLSLGLSVYGYDAKANDYTEQCKKLGMQFSTKYEKAFLKVDFCICTGAIKNNKYLTVLNKLKIPVYDRAQALGYLATKFKCVIAVAGTHGKSTTSSLIYKILSSAGKKVSCHIGADVVNARFNLGDDYLVVEACEYNKSFLNFMPTISVVTNVEAEHMDCYKSMFNLKLAFSTFLKRGKLRFAGDNKTTKFFKNIKDVNFVPKLKDVRLQPILKGEYNLQNISMAYTVAKSLGIKEDVIFKTINSFTGVHRRYELIGCTDGIKLYIDYAHHPSEIEAFVKQFNNEHSNNLIVFQPHTYSRTKMLFPHFIRVLNKIPNLCIYKEYPSREKPSQGVCAYQLYKELIKGGTKCKYCASVKKLAKHIKGVDAVAFVGAGDIDKIAEKFK